LLLKVVRDKFRIASLHHHLINKNPSRLPCSAAPPLTDLMAKSGELKISGHGFRKFKSKVFRLLTED